jgi:carbon monoxide dehydrogenase subunit G
VGHEQGKERVQDVQHAADSIKVAQTFAGENGEFNQEFDLKINGVAQEIKGFADQPAKASAKWDASVLVLDISQDFQGGDTSGTFKVNERWELSADGKTLTIVTKLTGPMGDMNSKRVMEKQ